MDAEGREVETLIEDWNASRVDIFAINKPDDVGFKIIRFAFFACRFHSNVGVARVMAKRFKPQNPIVCFFSSLFVSELGFLWRYEILFSRTGRKG